MSGTPSTQIRTPSSLEAKNRYVPLWKLAVRVHRAENPSAGIPVAGAPVPHRKSSPVSFRTIVGLPVKKRLEKYSPLQVNGTAVGVGVGHGWGVRVAVTVSSPRGGAVADGVALDVGSGASVGPKVGDHTGEIVAVGCRIGVDTGEAVPPGTMVSPTSAMRITAES